MVEAVVAVPGTSVSDGSWRTREGLPLPPILAAALANLQEHGYHGTTVRGIASGVGLTMPSLYYHYGNKEGILFALLDIAMDDLLARIRDGLEEAGSGTEARLANFVTAVALHNTRRRDLAKLHDESRFLGPELREQYIAKRSVVDDTLIGLLDEGVEAGLFETEDAHFTSRLVLGMCNSIVDWYSAAGSSTAEEIAERYAQSAVRLVTVNASS
ncbi:TetR/AcrR family transcriptional regulator [Modestobacter versicolor]|uniref:TetR/AcrR family transcriptional regulator n=1 Tax=Modestobacter versicolor TaxID=429133 RepID=UPI0034DEEBA4